LLRITSPITERIRRNMIDITEKEFIQFSQLIESRYGIHLKSEKKSLLMGRLQNVLMKKNFHNFTQYYDYIIQDKTGTATNELVDKITTNHTFFLREKGHFTFFEDVVLPYFEKTLKDGFRVWSAGCSSGEEPYTLSMILSDFISNHKIQSEARILATDISDKVLNQARTGVYTSESIDVLPNMWKLRYLNKIDHEKYEFNQSIKEKILFKKFNLMNDFPFRRKFHTIFCRNVMIYFDYSTRSELIKKFYDAIEIGGYLFIGQSESIIRDNNQFQYIMPSVYRKV